MSRGLVSQMQEKEKVVSAVASPLIVRHSGKKKTKKRSGVLCEEDSRDVAFTVLLGS
jgi:hypothetical protein